MLLYTIHNKDGSVSLQITLKMQIAKWWCYGFLAFQDVIPFSPVAKYQEATCSNIKH